ncbi:MAG TPA: hypothetical protein VGL66_00585 [Caulobacteraceae bacterium]|jgi:hypothetical protein
MSFVRRLWMILGSLLVCLAAPIAAHAQCAAFPPAITISVPLDPFGASPQINTTATWTVTDPDDNAIDTVFLLVPESPATTSTATILGTGGNPGDGSNVNLVVSTPPVINVDSVNGLKLNYNGTSHSDTAILTITIPAGANLVAGQNDIFYDVYYACKSSGGVKTGTTEVSKGLDIKFTVPSELQASFAGTAMDFGDITTVTNAQAASHVVNGQINVKSTAPYTVAVSSAGGFIMTPGGGGGTSAAQKIGYQWGFLSESVGGNSGGASTTFTTVTCKAPPSLSAVPLPVTTTLNEGGLGKASGSYKDTVSVTFTPLVSPYPALTNCP